MAKICRDCSNGQCDDETYLVYITTKKGFRYGSNCPPEGGIGTVREEYWFTQVTGKVGGLSIKDVEVTYNDLPPRRELVKALVLQLNEGFIRLFFADGRNFYRSFESSPSENRLKGYMREYEGDCNEYSYFIDKIELVGDNDGNGANQPKIKCKCTNGDQEIKCASAEGGICCIPKSLLDALCKKV